MASLAFGWHDLWSVCFASLVGLSSQTSSDASVDIFEELRRASAQLEEVPEELVLELALEVPRVIDASTDLPVEERIDRLQQLRRLLLDRKFMGFTPDRELEAEYRISTTGYRIANLYQASGDRERALAMLYESLELADPGNYGIPGLCEFAAAIERDAGNYKVALKLVQRGKAALSPEMEAYFTEARPTLDLELAHVQLALGMIDECESTLSRTKPLIELHGDKHHDAYLWGSLYQKWVSLRIFQADYKAVENLVEDYDRARLRDANRAALAEQARPAWRHRVSSENNSMMYARLGLAMAQQEFQSGDRAGRGLGQLYEALACGSLNVDETARTNAWIAAAHLDLGELHQAQIALDYAQDQIAQMRGDHTPLINEIAFLRARASGLRARGQEDLKALLDEEVMPAFEDFLHDWAATPIRRGGINYLQYATRTGFLTGMIDLAMRAMGDKRGAKFSIDLLMRVQALGTLARERQLVAPTLEEIRSVLLGDERGLLCYVPGREHSFVFLITNDRIRCERIPTRHALETDVQQLVSSIASVLQTPFEANSEQEDSFVQRLYMRNRERVSRSMIPEALHEELEQLQSLGVVGLDSFGYVPFEALAFDGDYVGSRFGVEIYPSVPLAVAIRQSDQSSLEREVLVIAGDGECAEPFEYPSLPVRSSRLKSVLGDLAPAADVYLASQSEPDWRKWLPRDAGGVFHFVGHGHYDSSRERASGLLVDPSQGESGVLFADAIEEHEFGPRMVLISACGAARARLRRGDDGRGSLGGAFLAHGTQAVVYSTMNLEYHASQDFMTVLFKELSAGTPIGLSMKRARMKARPSEFGVHPVHSYLLQLHGHGALALEHPK